MSPSCDNADPHVRYFRTGQSAFMSSLQQMFHDESLPVSVKFVFGDRRFKYQTCAFRKRLHQKPDFSVMPQRLVMADTDDRFCDGLFVYDLAAHQFCVDPESVFDPVYQEIPFQFSHDADSDLPGAFLPGNFQGRILLFKLLHLLKKGYRILLSQSLQSICKRRFDEGLSGFFRAASQSLSCVCVPESQNSTYGACFSLVCSGKLVTVIEPYLLHFFRFRLLIFS